MPGDPASVAARPVAERGDGPDRTRVLLTLWVVAGRDMLRHVVLDGPDDVTIGRAGSDHAAPDRAGPGIALTDVSVSRRHVRVWRNGDGTVSVEDLASTNGTAVNGQPTGRAELRPGDRLEIGSVPLRLDLLSAEEIAHMRTVLGHVDADGRDATGLCTADFLAEELPGWMTRTSSAGATLTALVIDVDPAPGLSDSVLAEVARVVMFGVRDTDVCVRDGWRIRAFLPDTDAARGAEVAERSRRAVEAHDWSRAGAPGLTVSIGVCRWDGAESADAWMARAADLIEGGGGRNRVACSNAENPPEGANH